VTWRARLAQEPQDEATRRAAMQAVNPLYIPRNHKVEEALAAAIQDERLRARSSELLAVLAKPFDERPGFESLRRRRQSGRFEARRYRTYCGT
jgi:uncharacterized protein YdiU (UPF0061 family)